MTGSDLQKYDAPGTHVIEPPERLPAVKAPSMLIIKLGTFQVDVTLDWLLRVLPEAPRQQVLDASIVMVTDPEARLARILKNEPASSEYLEIHTAALG